MIETVREREKKKEIQREREKIEIQREREREVRASHIRDYGYQRGEPGNWTRRVSHARTYARLYAPFPIPAYMKIYIYINSILVSYVCTHLSYATSALQELARAQDWVSGSALGTLLAICLRASTPTTCLLSWQQPTAWKRSFCGRLSLPWDINTWAIEKESKKDTGNKPTAAIVANAIRVDQTGASCHTFCFKIFVFFAFNV